MKRLLIPVLVTVLFSSCNDSLEKVIGLSKPQLRTSDPTPGEAPTLPEIVEITSSPHVVVESQEPSVEFPLEKTLTDIKGRTINAKILAKKGNQIAIARIPSNQQFILTLEMLAEADRVVLASIADGGDFGASETTALSTDRRAVWHAHIDNAEKEATRLGIPLLIAVSNGMDKDASAELEKTLVYSGEFKKWADGNVALCLLEVESGSREGTFETWKTLAKYGIKQSKASAVALINPTDLTSKAIPLSAVTSVDRGILSLDNAISKQSSWASICAAPTPERQASPFKVNRRISAGAT